MGYKKSLALMVLLGLRLAAQTGTGSIKGTVTDPSGAAMPNVTVQARNLGTAIITTARTTAEGAFTLVDLNPGTYEVVAEATGFKKTAVANVLVDIAVTTHVDIHLAIGNITETVEVSGGASVITPDTAESGTVLTATEYENLP